MDNQDEQGEFDELPPSKTQRKREMTALQKLGEALVELSERELAKIPVEDEKLLETIREARGIRSNSARRRHLQYPGKLMRKVDPTPIQSALDELHQQHQGQTRVFHELEALRDSLLSEGDTALQQLVTRFPNTDRQFVRQLQRQHSREVSQGKPPAASRKLFKYLRELTEAG